MTNQRRKISGGAGARGRGTVLLMVVGVLALLSIIAVVYAAIGAADRRGSAAYVRDASLSFKARDIADYLAGKIGEDTFSTVTETIPGLLPRTKRAPWDYPDIEQANDILSILPLAGAARRFDPVMDGRDGWLSALEPTWLNAANLAATDPLRPYLDYRDWGQISNFSPDGRFSNFNNLRNNFNAEPGFAAMGVNGRRQINYGLTLFDPLSGLAYNPAAGPVRLDDGTTIAMPNVPSHWTKRQARAFRPIHDIDRRASAPGPSTDAYLPNQWVDTDGDRNGDARPFELVDATYALTNIIRTVVPTDGRMRVFVAARAIDLSAKVNVNSASDFFTVPNESYPAGITPADIDLRNALSLTDIYQRYIRGGQPVGYDGFEHPAGSTTADYSPYSASAAAAVGRSAYASLRYTVENAGEVAPAQNAPYGPDAAFSAKGRFDFFDLFGYNPTGARNFGPGATLRTSRPPFGFSDLVELLTFHGANDDGAISRLENVLDGRSVLPPAQWPNFGPLRSNRPAHVERGGRGNSFPLPQSHPANDGQADDDALLQAVADLRHRVTTVSGARPITSLVSPRVSITGDTLSEGELRVNPLEILKVGSGTPPTPQDKRDYLSALCDVLIPFRDNDPATDTVWQRTTGLGTLSYGGSAELAYRVAVGLTANTIAALDDDDALDHDNKPPSAMSVVVAAAPGVIPPPDFNYPFDPLHLPAEELALPGTPLQSSARFNVFGIEAQPFIVEVGHYVWFTDTPADADPAGNADDEWSRRIINPPPQPDSPVPVTINERVERANPDFLGEILVFQLTNPFDRDIILTRATDNNGDNNADVLWYLEYAGQTYQLGRQQDAGTTAIVAMEEIRLPALSTRVFYTTSPQTTADFNARFELTNAVFPNSVPPDFLDRWVATHLGADALKIPMVDAKSGQVIPAAATTGVMDFFGETLGNVTVEGRRVAYLWRVLRAGVDEDPASQNETVNDYLADRIRQPDGGPPVLHQRLPASFSPEGWGNDVIGSQAGNDRDGIPGNDLDNTGFSLTMWASIRRPTRPAGVTNIPAGAMPPWCYETVAPSPSPYTTSYNQSNIGPVSDIGTVGDYDFVGQPRYRRLADLVVDQLASPASLNGQIRLAPDAKTGNPIPTSQSYKNVGGALAPKTFLDQAIEIRLGGRPVPDPAGIQQPPRNPGLFKRVGDFLLPLAIAPTSDPFRGAGQFLRPLALELQWMTLAECLALASDYTSPPAFDLVTAQPSLLHRFGHDDASTIRPRADRGHLVLDNFAPFVDANVNGVFDPGEQTVGLGVPLALGVFDKFRTSDYGGLDQAVHGVLNIATAPLSNLALLPLITPDQVSRWTTTDNMGDPNSPWLRLFDPATQAADRAATLAAYRDKARVHPRRTLGSSTAGVPLNFRDDNDGVALDNNGRQYATLIPGLREDLGLRSIGEIMAARVANTAILDDPSNNIDHLGNDAAALINYGIDPVRYRNGLADTPGAVIDDYAEKLAVATAAAGAVSVRSDYFAVWFVVYGFLPSDVEGLSSEDPLIPSVARRYLMVVDRSNMRSRIPDLTATPPRPSDKPRILLFQELPM